ncbi:MAG TPA: Ig-like domain-containing protein [Nocardioides sp.]|nr:Ig-like domain-containing protein [Nocardioides sp.]
MNIRTSKRWAVALGAAVLASTVSGIAAATPVFTGDPTSLAWYTGDEATVSDPARTDVPLRLYDATGAVVTTGSTSAALPAFAAAGGAIRPDDTHATLFVHVAQSGTAAGAWPGVAASGTTRYAGDGAASAPAAVAGRPFAATAGGYRLADVVAATAAAGQGDFAGVYELRLRTSSRAAGVGTRYASTYVKVSGGTWSVVDGPQVGDPEPGATTTTTAAVPAGAVYGKAFSVPVTVTGTAGSGGTVQVKDGTKVLASGTLAATGKVTLVVGGTALAPGSHTLTVSYGGTAQAKASQATGSVSVAKAASTTAAKLKAKKISRTKKPVVSVTLAAAGLPGSALTGVVTVRDGAKTIKTVTVAAAAGGKVTITLPKRKKGTHKIQVRYAGNTVAAGSSSAVLKLKVT